MISFLEKVSAREFDDNNLNITGGSIFNNDKLVKINSNLDNIIPNQYIVVFKDNVKDVTSLTSSIVKKIKERTFQDLQIRAIYENTIKGYVVKITSQNQLAQMLVDPNIKYIEPDQRVQSFPHPQSSETGYHYEPFFTATGTNFVDEASRSDLRLSQFTVATWFKTSVPSFPDEGVMVNKGGLGSESTGGNQNYGIWFLSNGRIQGGYETSGGSNRYVTTSNTYNDDQWHHGVVTYDGSTVRLYIDGTQIGTRSSTTTPDNNGNQPLRIAENAQSIGEDSYVGQLDEVGVWNRALSNTEINSLKDTGVFPTNGRVYSNSFGSSSPPPPPPPPPPEPENCTDGIDNDGDGLIDINDPDCQSPENCTDGIDNDGDGLIDINDPDCQSPEVCDDGIDNDGDGLIDINDPDCQSPENCTDGIDNDGDGLIDGADPDCPSTPPPTGGYHYEPFFTATGTNFVDEASRSDLRLSQFTVATWFKTSVPS
ncbi:MAG: LamG-like jellyroll fold domain-containing protein, partial [Nitrososphaeraceae archaeon]